MTQKKHGGTKTRLYRIWGLMRFRCSEKSIDFKYYGARGITVCAEWENFVTFRDWALSNGYRNNLTIERLDNDEGYCPANCTWATRAQQSHNRRCVRAIVRSDGRVYESVKRAADENGTSARSVSFALKGQQKTAAGFGWVYAEPDLEKALISERQEEVLSYFTGLAPLGSHVHYRVPDAVSDLNIDRRSLQKDVYRLASLGALEIVEVGVPSRPSVLLVRMRPEELPASPSRRASA